MKKIRKIRILDLWFLGEFIIIYLFWAAQECRTGHKGVKHLQVPQTKPNNKNTKISSNVNNYTIQYNIKSRKASTDYHQIEQASSITSLQGQSFMPKHCTMSTVLMKYVTHITYTISTMIIFIHHNHGSSKNK